MLGIHNERRLCANFCGFAGERQGCVIGKYGIECKCSDTDRDAEKRKDEEESFQRVDASVVCVFKLSGLLRQRIFTTAGLSPASLMAVASDA